MEREGKEGEGKGGRGEEGKERGRKGRGKGSVPAGIIFHLHPWRQGSLHFKALAGVIPCEYRCT